MSDTEEMKVQSKSYQSMCQEIAELCGCYFCDGTFKSGVMDDCEVINPIELQESIANILIKYGWKTKGETG